MSNQATTPTSLQCKKMKALWQLSQRALCNQREGYSDLCESRDYVNLLCSALGLNWYILHFPPIGKNRKPSVEPVEIIFEDVEVDIFALFLIALVEAGWLLRPKNCHPEGPPVFMRVDWVSALFFSTIWLFDPPLIGKNSMPKTGDVIIHRRKTIPVPLS